MVTTQTKWTVDRTHSEVAFKIKHLMISNVKGMFNTFEATIYTTSNDFSTADIDLWIDPSSISTGDLKRDEHLKSPEFFDVLNHRQITFISNTIGQPDEKGNHELWGELTMLGITKNIKLNVQFGGIIQDPWENEKAGFTVSGVIRRSDWGLTWNAPLEAGGVLISDEIKILCEIELINKGQTDPRMILEKAGRYRGINS